MYMYVNIYLKSYLRIGINFCDNPKIATNWVVRIKYNVYFYFDVYFFYSNVWKRM